MPAAQSRDLARTTFQLLMLAALIGTSLWIMRPFLVALTWATMIAVSTWPLLLRAQAALGGRRSLAVALMTTALLLVLVVPLYFAVTTVVENLAQLVRWSTTLATLTIPPMPTWVASLPVIGPKIAESWQELTAGSPEEIAAQLAPFGQRVAYWFAAQVGNIGLLLLQFLLTVIIATILYSKGETAAGVVDRFARRLAGTQGENAVHIAAQAIRAVALGVVVTALVQSILGGIGLAVAGVPFAAVLTALMFILGVAQIGAAPVLIVAAIWVYARTGAGWGTAFVVWAIFCATFDNFLRPLLIRRGADLPLLLIFVGVIGGLVAFGVIGLFIGPAVLAVAYALLVEWMSEADPPDERVQSAERPKPAPGNN
jgi:predicted PurR-regulated permease PerM